MKYFSLKFLSCVIMNHQKVNCKIVFYKETIWKINGKVMFVLTPYIMSIFHKLCSLRTWITGNQQKLIITLRHYHL